MKNVTFSIFAVPVSIVLAACGGGSSSSSAPVPPVATTPSSPFTPVVIPADV